MQFLYPVYLFGFFLIAIPIIIHLFKLRRYKTVYFSSLRFLQNAQETFKNKSRLRDILLLISRILLISFLVLAFAQPYRTNNQHFSERSSHVVGICIDATMSMSNQATEGSLFDQAKIQAIEIINNHPLGTSFLIFDANQPNSFFTILDRYQAIENIKRIEMYYPGDTFELMLKKIINYTALKEIAINTIHLFSDFQESYFNSDNIQNILGPEISLHHLETKNFSNIYIDTCWLEQPIHHFGSRITITGRIKNTGIQSYQQFPINMIVNDSIVARTTIELPENSVKSFSISYLPYQNGNQNMELRINDYPVDFDNSFYLSFNLNQKTRVCHIYSEDPNPYILAALMEDSAFAFSDYPLTAFPDQDFSQYETVIVSDLKESDWAHNANFISFVENGGNLIVFASSTNSNEGVNRLAVSFEAPRLLELISQREDIRFSETMKNFHSEISLNPESILNWPSTNSYFRISNPGIKSRVIMETTTRRPVIVTTRFKQGSFVIYSFPLETQQTTIGEHPLFIPLLYYLCTAESREATIYSRIGSSLAFPIPLLAKTASKVRLFTTDADFNIIPQQESIEDNPITEVYLNDYIGQSGFIFADLDGNDPLGIALNYPRTESSMSFHTSDMLREMAQLTNNKITMHQRIKESPILVDSLKKTASGLPATRVFLISALLMLVFETLLIRIKT